MVHSFDRDLFRGMVSVAYLPIALTLLDPGVDLPGIPRVTLHQHIHYRSSYPPIAYDVRENPQTDARFTEVDRPLTQWDLGMRFTCEPPLESMTLTSPYFPWYVEVRATHPSGVTILDLLNSIFTCMSTPVCMY